MKYASLLLSAMQLAAGRLKALAVSTAERVPQLPAVPTLSDSGVPGFDLFNWFALFGPADIPEAAVRRLHAAVAQALAAPEVVKIWQAQGIVAQRMSIAELHDFLKGEASRYRSLIQDIGVKVE